MTERVRWSRRDWLTMAGSALVVVVLAVLVAGVIALVGSGSSVAAVTLEPAGQSGADPFTASVQIGPAVAFAGTVQAITVAARKSLPSDPKTHTLVASGSTPGLYGGSGDVHVCNPQQLVTFLQQHPAKAAAWASVLGISPSDIATYVNSLTPVVLTSDTLVTNHGYRDGHATTLQSVLQAGTAVMVDSYGTPRVKCNCGNPLTPPALVNPTHYRGTAWAGYAPTQVTVVHTGPTIVNLTVINITTGDTYTQPVGNSGGEFVAAELTGADQTTIVTSRDGRTWTTATVITNETVSALAWGNGEWIALSHHLPSGGGQIDQPDVLVSTDLHSWQRASSPPDRGLGRVVYGNGRWTAVGASDHSGSGFFSGVVYTSTDGERWELVCDFATVACPQSGYLNSSRVLADKEFDSVAYGNGQWIAVAGSNLQVPASGLANFTSTNGTHWVTPTENSVPNATSGQIAYGAGKWVIGANLGLATPAGSVIEISNDGRSWEAATPTPFAQAPIGAIAYGNGMWLALAHGVFTSTDARTWSRAAPALPNVTAVAFGGGSSTGGAATPPASTTTTPIASSLAHVDWKNYTYQDVACGTRETVRLTNGSWPYANSPCGMGISFVAVDYADVTGDGVPDAIVNILASGGGSAFAEWATVFTGSPHGPVNVGYVTGASFPPYSSGIITWIPHYVGSEPHCCPSQYEKDAYTYSNGRFTKSGTTYVPAGELPKR